jgi:hypothetical protein
LGDGGNTGHLFGTADQAEHSSHKVRILYLLPRTFSGDFGNFIIIESVTIDP